MVKVNTERDELKADLVFAPYVETITPTAANEGRVKWWTKDGNQKWVRWDGTLAGLCEAVRAARKVGE